MGEKKISQVGQIAESKFEEIELLLQTAQRLNETIMENADSMEINDLLKGQNYDDPLRNLFRKSNEENREITYEINNLLRMAQEKLESLGEMNSELLEIEVPTTA